jgi:hypothetical protein
MMELFFHADSTSCQGVIVVTVRNPNFDKAGWLAGEAVTLKKLAELSLAASARVATSRE